MDLHELRVAARLIDELAKRALFAEKQMVALEGQCAEWRRIADELKAERNAEREQHTAIKQALGVQDAKEAGKVLGIVEGEGLRGAAERMIKERDALRAEIDNLTTRLRQSIARGDFAEMRLATLTAEMETERAPRSHPVEGSWEASHITPEGKRTAEGAVPIVVGDFVEVFQSTTSWTFRDEVGILGRVVEIHPTNYSIPVVNLSDGGAYALCDVRKVAAVKREPKPGDVVRLVREPTHTDIPAMLPWSNAFGMPGDTATVVIMAVPDKLPNGTIPVRTSKGQAFFWPLSCIEVVKGGDK